MKKLFLFSVLAGLLCTCSGCWLMQEPANNPPELYDLTPPAVRAEHSCTFGRVRNLSPAGRKMLYRHPGNRITDSAVSWVQSPDALLFRYLESRFPADAKAPQIRLSILRFELDLTTDQAEAIIDMVMKSASMFKQSCIVFLNSVSIPQSVL